MKIFIDPPNSMILFDLVERFGHEPLSAMAVIQEKVDNVEVDMPPMNVTLDDIIAGLEYAGVEVPSGIRGRMALWGPMVKQADAAVVIKDPPFSFGCVGCDRSNEMIKYLVKRRGIPMLELDYPNDEEEAKTMVGLIRDFLNGLEKNPTGGETEA